MRHRGKQAAAASRRFWKDGYTIERQLLAEERAFNLRLEIYQELGLLVRVGLSQAICSLICSSCTAAKQLSGRLRRNSARNIAILANWRVPMLVLNLCDDLSQATICDLHLQSSYIQVRMLEYTRRTARPAA